MKRLIRNIFCMLLMFSLLPLLSGCDNEDDVIGIFTGKGSSADSPIKAAMPNSIQTFGTTMRKR